VIEHKRAALALASAKAAVSSYLSSQSLPQSSLLKESGVVSVLELCLTTADFRQSLLPS